MGLFFITLAGAIFRLIGINKLQGLWNDEYVSWAIASAPFSDGFADAVKSQCHMPLYYIYLKTFMAWFGQSDLALRLSSFVLGVLGIVAMYFVGREKDKKTGLVAATITAISSFAIYYSQEVRIYSLLFLVSAISLLYFVKFVKARTVTNLLGLIIFDFLIIFTHTIGFVFVFFQLIALTVLLFKDYKKQLGTVWASLCLFCAICSPQVWAILTAKTFSQWWGSFTFSKIVFLFTDYFSPVLTNLVNAPDEVFYVKTFAFVLFTFAPTAIAVFFLGKSLFQKDKTNLAFLIPTVGFVTVMSVASIMGKLVFITKYSTEIYPILIFLVACGVCSFKKKAFSWVLFSLYCLINLTYLVISPTSAPKIPRLQGHKIVADLLNRSNLKKGDVIILEYYGADRFGKYFDFSDYKVVEINKANFGEYLAKGADYKKTYENGKELFKDTFSGKNTDYFEQTLNSKIDLDNLEENRHVVVISADCVALYGKHAILEIAKDDFQYEKTPLMYLAFSYVKNQVTEDLMKSLNVTRAEKSGDWSLIEFTKLNKKGRK